MTGGRTIFAHLVVALAVATMIALGIWQLSRASWKDALIERYAQAPSLPEVTLPTEAGAPAPLFRRAKATCSRVDALRTASGANRDGEPGFVIIADCPGLAVELGWSKNPQALTTWRGGTVHGIVRPDRADGVRLVADAAPAGLAASAAPSLAAIPNNHRGYALQWFFFAAAAVTIYALALRRRSAELA